MARRYITYIGYFGPTSNLKTAPAALTGDVVAQLLGALPDRNPRIATVNGAEVRK